MKRTDVFILGANTGCAAVVLQSVSAASSTLAIVYFDVISVRRSFLVILLVLISTNEGVVIRIHGALEFVNLLLHALTERLAFFEVVRPFRWAKGAEKT